MTAHAQHPSTAAQAAPAASATRSDGSAAGRHRCTRLATGLATTAALATAFLASAPAPATAAPHTGHPSRVTVKASSRVQSLVSQMTLDEKLSFVSPSDDPENRGQAGYIPGVPRLGIPELRLTDGPAGVRLSQHTTALPAPVMLASTFDPQLARAYGATMGREGRALGEDVLLGPMANVIRVPNGGRNFESFSEDPLVNARTVAPEIKGIQSTHMIATIKHFAENNQETNRTDVDVQVDDQALHEIELPGFQAAVHAGVGAVMCSYNSVNGAHSCGNSNLLNTILKTQLGFRGFVMSDWGATHAPTDLLAGLDMDMHWVHLAPEDYFSTQLKSAITDGTIPESALDDAVSRILGSMNRAGLLDGADNHRPTLDLAAGAKVAQKVAEAGSVLLKDSRHALPLTGKEKSIALIGPTAQDPKIGGGGSANVVPASAQSPLQAISARAGHHTKVTWSAGVPTQGAPIPADAFSPGAPFDSTGTVQVTTQQSVNYSGTLNVPVAGTYSFKVDAPQAYAALTVDGAPVATGILAPATGTVTLSAGTHQITYFAFAATGVDTTSTLTWITPDMAAQAAQAAAQVAKTAQTAIVFAFDDGTEGADRSTLDLPAGQDALINAVTAANPNTIVVLNTGSSVTMPWLSKVKAVLDTYFPGENGAEATARLLYGDVNPSGKLTQTFATSDDTTPFTGKPASYPGVGNTETYDEGIYVGYRWYDHTGTKPLFPFGYGLSYTTFRYSHLHLTTARNGGFLATFNLTNTGQRAGADVPQVYLGPSPLVTEQQADRKLAGYTKVYLRPGDTRRISLPISAHQLDVWNTSIKSWTRGGGLRSVWVGGSSDNLPLAGKVQAGR